MENKISMREINEWLDQPVVVYPTDPHVPKLELKHYYTDSEMKRFFSKEKSKVKINDKTRRNDANNIFCELVDYCEKYKIYDGDKLFVNPSNKSSFYHFIYSNSRK
jgi:hypothetical protein